MNSDSAPIFTPHQLDEIASVLRAISHPIKLEILQILVREEPLDVSTLCSRVSVCEISMMSHHLAKLKDKGILHSERKGKRVLYSLREKNIVNLFHCMHSCEFIHTSNPSL